MKRTHTDGRAVVTAMVPIDAPNGGESYRIELSDGDRILANYDMATADDGFAIATVSMVSRCGILEGSLCGTTDWMLGVSTRDVPGAATLTAFSDNMDDFEQAFVNLNAAWHVFAAHITDAHPELGREAEGVDC